MSIEPRPEWWREREASISPLADLVIRERINPIANTYVNGFNVFTWLQGEPELSAEIGKLEVPEAITQALRPKLQPHLEQLAASGGKVRKHQYAELNLSETEHRLYLIEEGCGGSCIATFPTAHSDASEATRLSKLIADSYDITLEVRGPHGDIFVRRGEAQEYLDSVASQGKE